jgi:RNA polymerase sigma-70 factor (ECF subfamily)
MAQALSEAKLRMWMQRLGPGLITLAAGICRDRHRAEEIVQEAFIQLWRRPPEAGEVAFHAWLRRVVSNLAINSLQRTRRPGALPEFDIQARPACGEGTAALEQREQLERVRAALERLDEPKRAILMLRAHEQLSYQEIAEALGIPVGTVMSRLNRARAALVEEMQAQSRESREEPMVYEFRKYEQA